MKRSFVGEMLFRIRQSVAAGRGEAMSTFRVPDLYASYGRFAAENRRRIERRSVVPLRSAGEA
jgi:hypothetical protein